MGKLPDFESAREYCTDILKTQLSPQLTYHTAGHTIAEVVPAVDQLSGMEKVNESERVLLLTAAYFHDLGFIRQRQEHESISIQIAQEALPLFGYSKAQIEIIRGIILATHLPQSPTTLLEEIMADADLDYLGQENFWERSGDLRTELANFGTSFSEEEWYQFQINFIQDHRYFTASARLLRDPLKQQHLIEIRKRYSQVLHSK